MAEWTRLFFCLAVLSLCLPTSRSEGGEPQLGGFLKSLNTLVEGAPGGLSRSGKFSSNRLRLDGRASLGPVSLMASVENQLLYTDPPGLLSLPGGSPNRRLDLETEWNRDGRFADRLIMDRLNLRATFSGLDWTIGRQAIGFGRISLFSPLDIIAPFPPDALDTEVRPGVDALRLSRFVGVTGQISAVAVFGETGADNSYLAFAEGNRAGVDLLIIGGSLRRRGVIGGGLATQLAGMGIKGELSWYAGEDVGRAGGDLHDDFAIAGVEIDYRFENDLILFLQYLYNGAGVEEPQDYPAAAASAPFAEGLSFLLARHYFLAGPSYELHPLARIDGLLIWNLADGSWLLRPLLDISLSDNWVLQLFYNANSGTKPKRSLLGSLPRSEFGSLGDSAGLFIKYFF